MKSNVIVSLVVGAALGFVVGRASKAAPPAAVAAAPQAVAAAPSAPAPTPAKPAAPSRPTEDPNAVYKIAVGDSPVKGPATAKVTIVESSDFQCPFCSRVTPTLKQLVDTYGNDVRVVFKHNPLSFHEHAHLAAEATMAAHEQGKFWEMHDKLFANQQALGRADLERYAQELGLDLAKFKAALDGGKFKERVDADQRAVVALGASGTPAFFINGRKVVGAQPFERFKAVVDEELKKADAKLAAGVKPEDLYAELVKDGATSPQMLPGAPAAEAPAPQAAAVKKVSIPAYSPVKGPKAARVTVVAWSDFQCPYCSRVTPTLKQIEETYGKDVRVVFRHQPLPFHPNAMPAAKAAMAANKQGKFWELHDLMFANQQQLGPAKYEEWARQLGLDLNRFKQDMDSKEIADQVQQDMNDGNAVGANGTPSFFINGRELVGAQPFPAFKAVIDEELGKANALLAKGVKLEDVYAQLQASAGSAAPAEAPAPPAPPAPVKVDVGNSPLKGKKTAPVTVVAFSDFQCPFCSRAVPIIKQIEDTYGDKVAVVFKQFPLSFHQNAQLAAEASLAAHEQGKFWPMHDKLFQNQQALDRASLERYAQELGLDVAKFKAALDSGKFKDQVAKDTAMGTSAGVQGTPSFVINGELVVGAQPFDAFKQTIDRKLASAQAVR